MPLEAPALLLAMPMISVGLGGRNQAHTGPARQPTLLASSCCPGGSETQGPSCLKGGRCGELPGGMDTQLHTQCQEQPWCPGDLAAPVQAERGLVV